MEAQQRASRRETGVTLMPRRPSALYEKMEDLRERGKCAPIANYHLHPAPGFVHRLRVLKHSKHRMQRVHRAVWLLLILFIAL